MTCWNADAFAYKLDALSIDEPLPASAYIPATSCALTLVPPKTFQPPTRVTYAATPVAGSATAATSLTVRFVHPVSCCQLGFGTKTLQPLPVPAQTLDCHVP